jgi:hypothetical protein
VVWVPCVGSELNLAQNGERRKNARFARRGDVLMDQQIEPPLQK